MERIKLQKLSLGSFIRMNFIASIWMGIFGGLIGLGILMSGIVPFSETVLGLNVEGMTAGIIFLIAFPIALALESVVVSAILGLGLKVHMFIFRGTWVRAKFKVEEPKKVDAPAKVELPVESEIDIEEIKIEE